MPTTILPAPPPGFSDLATGLQYLQMYKTLMLGLLFIASKIFKVCILYRMAMIIDSSVWVIVILAHKSRLLNQLNNPTPTKSKPPTILGQGIPVVTQRSHSSRLFYWHPSFVQKLTQIRPKNY